MRAISARRICSSQQVFKEVQVHVCVFIAVLQGPFTQNLNVFPQSCENSIHVLPPSFQKQNEIYQVVPGNHVIKTTVGSNTD